jgi:hypothetical protein
MKDLGYWEEETSASRSLVVDVARYKSRRSEERCPMVGEVQMLPNPGIISAERRLTRGWPHVPCSHASSCNSASGAQSLAYWVGDCCSRVELWIDMNSEFG